MIHAVHGSAQSRLRTGTNRTCHSGRVRTTSLQPWWDDLNLVSGGNWYAVGHLERQSPYGIRVGERADQGQPAPASPFRSGSRTGRATSGSPIRRWFNPGTPTATVGAEDSGGKEGVQYYYNVTGQIPTGTKDLRIGLASTKVYIQGQRGRPERQQHVERGIGHRGSSPTRRPRPTRASAARRPRPSRASPSRRSLHPDRLARWLAVRQISGVAQHHAVLHAGQFRQHRSTQGAVQLR